MHPHDVYLSNQKRYQIIAENAGLILARQNSLQILYFYTGETDVPFFSIPDVDFHFNNSPNIINSTVFKLFKTEYQIDVIFICTFKNI